MEELQRGTRQKHFTYVCIIAKIFEMGEERKKMEGNVGPAIKKENEEKFYGWMK